MMDRDVNAPPLNPLPPVVWLMALPLIAMEVVVQFGARGFAGPAGAGWRLDAVQRLAFSPDFLRRMWAADQYPMDGLMRMVSYVLVHTSFTHFIFVLVFLLALGKFVGEVYRWWAVLAVVVGSAVVAAVVYTLVPFTQNALIGGYPAVYGLIGAFTFMLWVRLAKTGGNPARAFTLIGFLLGTQLLFGLLFGGGTEWIADLAGFATGFLMSFVVSPGGWARVMEKVRSR
jgi:membrane associated rhomboid family serine protease